MLAFRSCSTYPRELSLAASCELISKLEQQTLQTYDASNHIEMNVICDDGLVVVDMTDMTMHCW